MTTSPLSSGWRSALQDRGPELGGLVEEEHAVVGPRDRTGQHRARAAAGEGGDRGAVVRRDERRGAVELGDLADRARRASARRGPRGPPPGRAAAGSSRAARRASSCRRPAGPSSAGGGPRWRRARAPPGPRAARRRRRGRRPSARPRAAAAPARPPGGAHPAAASRYQRTTWASERAPWTTTSLDELGLGDVLVGDDDVAHPAPRGGEDGREHAAHAARAARRGASSPRWTTSSTSRRADGPAAASTATAMREVEGRAPLGDRGRREVDGDPVRRDRGPRRGAAARTRSGAWAQAASGSPPTMKHGRPGGDVGLDVDEGAVEPGEGHRAGAPEPEGHDPTPTTWRSRGGAAAAGRARRRRRPQAGRPAPVRSRA